VDDLTNLKITLKHARLYMAWATSAARLASRPLPYVLLDEIDKYPVVSNKKETGPVELSRKRTRTFGHMRKIIRVSTPTVVSGPVWQALETECEAVFNFWVRCPLCGHTHLMDFKSIGWDGGSGADPRLVLSDPRSTWYVCPGCSERWDDARRDQAVAAGEWRDRVEGVGLNAYLASRRPVVIGFHYRAWISRFVPLREAAAAFIRGLSDPIKLRDFQNDYNAEPWLDHQAARPKEPIMQLIEDRPRGVVPSDQPISGLTAGIDTQDDGLWYWIHAWGLSDPGQRPRSWCVRAGFVLSFEDLAEVLWSDVYLDAESKQYVIELALQDSAGHRTAEVYDFARANPGRLFPALGRKTMNSPYRWSPQTHYPGAKRAIAGRALQLLNVNTKYWKDEAAAALQVAPGDPGGIGLYGDFPAEYVSHLVAEYVDEAGFWECPGSRANHLWDCLVLNFVAAEVRGIRYRRRVQGVAPATQPPPPRPRLALW
jgi:phage terminase large subunit GpA-like protein